MFDHLFKSLYYLARNKTKSADEEDEEETNFNSTYEIIEDYADHSTIQGFVNIFFTYQTIFGKVFWILVILLMQILGLYWCIKAYVEWQDNPVLTMISTTAYSVKQVILI